MAATRTRAELIAKALQELKVLAAGQSPSPEDGDLVDAEIDPLLAELAARQILSCSSTAFPVAVFSPLARRLAASCAGAFGVTDGPSIEDEEWRLSRITASSPTYEPLQVDDQGTSTGPSDYS